jgi:uncharacterized protein (UPF0332 family)
MSVSPLEILNLAKTLQGFSKAEANARCVISRAYYAALHRVEITFEKRADQYRVDGESSHQEIISRAKVYGSNLNPGRTSAAEIAKMMPKMRRTRNSADYELAIQLPTEQVADTVARAERVFALCDEIEKKRLTTSAEAQKITGEK